MIDKKSSSGQNSKGLYILTGSTKPLTKDASIHSKAGRIYTLKIGTLTICEILNLNENDSISLSSLAQNNTSFERLTNPLSICKFNQLMLQGGWSEVYAHQIDGQTLVNEYLLTLIKRDSENYKFKLNKKYIKQILFSLARLNGSQLNKSAIKKESKVNMDHKTLDNYFEFLYDNEIIFDVTP